MGNILSRPISKIEHGIHIILLFLTGGGWILFYIARIIIYKNKSKVVAGSSKERILSKVDQINAKQKAPSGSATYVKRTFASEEEAEDATAGAAAGGIRGAAAAAAAAAALPAMAVVRGRIAA